MNNNPNRRAKPMQHNPVVLAHGVPAAAGAGPAAAEAEADDSSEDEEAAVAELLQPA